MKVVIVRKDETEDAVLGCHKFTSALGFKLTERNIMADKSGGGRR